MKPSITSTTPIWGIHAGKTGDAASLFLSKNCVALGWHSMGDLSKLSPTRDAYKAAVAQVYPDKKAGAIPNNAGQLFSFVHEMKVGDLVVFPNKTDRRIYVGEVIGDYEYNPKLEPGYPNVRKVKWLKTLERMVFTQGALYEIGSAMSLFQVKTYADEFRGALEGKAMAPPVSEDLTIPNVAAGIEETTRDFQHYEKFDSRYKSVLPLRRIYVPELTRLSLLGTWRLKFTRRSGHFRAKVCTTKRERWR